MCYVCNDSPNEIITIVNEGNSEPEGRVKHEWRFTFTSIERVKKVKRLQRDFELNLPGVAIALHLLDRIKQLASVLDTVKK